MLRLRAPLLRVLATTASLLRVLTPLLCVLVLTRKENVQQDVTQLKELKAQYLEATGEDWDVKSGAKKPSAASKAKDNQQARVEKMAAAEPASEPAAEGDDAAGDGVRHHTRSLARRACACAPSCGRGSGALGLRHEG